jgi:hypothetical protein
MTNKRISLVEGLKRDQEPIDPIIEQNFLKYGSATPPPEAVQAVESVTAVAVPVADAPTPKRPAAKRVKPSKVTPIGLIPVTVRLRPEIAGALKRASLERQLQGEELYTQQDIVEQALEPWLREEGYLA